MIVNRNGLYISQQMVGFGEATAEVMQNADEAMKIENGSRILKAGDFLWKCRNNGF
jgi:hypothetical protein